MPKCQARLEYIKGCRKSTGNLIISYDIVLSGYPLGVYKQEVERDGWPPK